MASSLFGNNPNPQPMNNNPLTMLQQFNQFKQSMQGRDPKAMVEQMLRDGRMSREQFDQLSQMATQLQQMFGM